MTGKRLLRSAFHLRTRHAHAPLRKQQARRYPPPPPRGSTVTLVRKAYDAKEKFYKALKATKLIYTLILCYRFVARFPPPQGARSCVELPGYARGWVPLPSPSHSTMLYTMMQVDRSLEDQVVHGRASTEQT